MRCLRKHSFRSTCFTRPRSTFFKLALVLVSVVKTMLKVLSSSAFYWKDSMIPSPVVPQLQGLKHWFLREATLNFSKRELTVI